MARKLVLSLIVLLILATAAIGCGGAPAPTTSAPAASVTTSAAAPTLTSAPTTNPASSQAATTSALPKPATTLASWQPSRPIVWICHNAPGSGYDTVSRAIIQYAKKYTNQEIIVKNVTGGAGALAAMEMWRSKPDGYTIGLFDLERLLMRPIFGNVDYQFDKYGFIGTVDRYYNLILVAAKSPYKTVDDLRKASLETPVRYVCDAVDIPGVLFPLVFNIKTVNVAGVGTGPNLVMALLRGEGEYMISTETASLGYVLSGELRPLVALVDKRGTAMTSVFEKNKIQFAIAPEVGGAELGGQYNARTVIVPPGTPPEIQAYWAGIIEKTLKDPEFLAFRDKASLTTEFVSKDDTSKIIDGMQKLYVKYHDALKDFIH